MTPPAEPLPDPIDARAFSTREGAAFGLSRSRMRANDLERPHVGVRVPKGCTPASVHDRARVYAAKMPPGAFFSHTTAAVLHGMWLPLDRERSTVLDVSVEKPQRAPRDEGVRGHHLVMRPGLVWTVGGVPVANPVNTWCQLATQLALEDLIAAGESLLTPQHRDARIRLDRLCAASSDIHRPRHAKLLRAAAALRVGSRSRKETLLRLLLVAAGLPEPEVNGDIADGAGVWVAQCDLVYRLQRVLIEYEGDYHRLDKDRFRADIARYEMLQDLGWRVVRVTEADFARPEVLIARIARLLAA